MSKIPSISSQPQSDASSPQEDDDRSFAEVLFTDAINPGVHKQSLDAANYALIALFVVASITLVLHNFSIHYIILLALTLVLAVLLNRYREDIMEASRTFLEEEAKREQEQEEEDGNDNNDDGHDVTESKQTSNDADDDNDNDNDSDHETVKQRLATHNESK